MEEQVIELLLTPGYTLELIHIVTGASRETIRTAAKTLENRRPDCTCRRIASHKGWCVPRKKLVERIALQRELKQLPVQRAVTLATVTVPEGHCQSDAACPFPIYREGLCGTHYQDAQSQLSLAPSTFNMLYDLRHLYVL